MIFVEISMKSLDEELGALSICNGNPDVIAGAKLALYWIRNGGARPHELAK